MLLSLLSGSFSNELLHAPRLTTVASARIAHIIFFFMSYLL